MKQSKGQTYQSTPNVCQNLASNSSWPLVTLLGHRVLQIWALTRRLRLGLERTTQLPAQGGFFLPEDETLEIYHCPVELWNPVGVIKIFVCKDEQTYTF